MKGSPRGHPAASCRAGLGTAIPEVSPRPGGPKEASGFQREEDTAASLLSRSHTALAGGWALPKQNIPAHLPPAVTPQQALEQPLPRHWDKPPLSDPHNLHSTA